MSHHLSNESEWLIKVRIFGLIWDLAAEDGIFCFGIILIFSMIFILFQILIIYLFCTSTLMSHNDESLSAQFCHLFYF